MMAKTLRRKSSVPPKPPAEIVVRHCHGLADFAACIEIERAVWGGADIELVPLPLLAVAAEAGGQVLGAFDGDRMVGFTLAIAGRRARRPFLHSHMTGVLEAYRNRGVGRRLKLFQREDAISRGIDLVEWTFDPLQLKNAYFNLVRLGAIARRFLPNLYGITTSPLHAGLPTDRLVAEWWLRSTRVKRAIAAAPGKPTPPRQRGREWVRIRVPALIGTLLRKRPDEATRLQADIRLEFEHWLGRGYAATFIEMDNQGGTYLLEPWSKR